jgi:hypothetical protein
MRAMAMQVSEAYSRDDATKAVRMNWGSSKRIEQRQESMRHPLMCLRARVS